VPVLWLRGIRGEDEDDRDREDDREDEDDRESQS
jgi:hypothetical protein